MRSSKSRSRSKNNRNRSVGNVMNRVFDSSGPEGKVRGTPQQIIEKYNQLARDAQLSNDIVAAENFQQHAEHYTRLLGAAQREQEARREQQEREHRERQQARAEQQQRRAEQQPPAAAPLDDPALGEQPDVLAPVDAGESTLVETPDERPARPRRSRKPRSRDGEPKAGEKPEGRQPPAAADERGGPPKAPEAAE